MQSFLPLPHAATGVFQNLIELKYFAGALAWYCAESIHVSAQPVAPSFGIRSLTGTFAAWSVFVWYGHDAPITASPDLNRSISSDASPQYFLMKGFCCLSSAIVASNCVLFSSYGSLMPSDGFVFIR